MIAKIVKKMIEKKIKEQQEQMLKDAYIVLFGVEKQEDTNFTVNKDGYGCYKGYRMGIDIDN